MVKTKRYGEDQDGRELCGMMVAIAKMVIVNYIYYNNDNDIDDNDDDEKISSRYHENKTLRCQEKNTDSRTKYFPNCSSH